MNVGTTKIRGVRLVEPVVHRDERGEFWRSFCRDELMKHDVDFNVVQSNVSVNPHLHTLRGFHFQDSPSCEQKILTLVAGAAYFVIVDLRSNSKTFLLWESFEIGFGDRSSVIVPSGCATGFLTLGEGTIVHYQMSDIFRPDCYGGFRFDDPLVGVRWPVAPEVISSRDLGFSPLRRDKFVGSEDGSQ
jgi:dTDP-4-dehydrorhamnose 3,5-epimerase